MKKYGINVDLNFYAEVKAKNESEAEEKVRELLTQVEVETPDGLEQGELHGWSFEEIPEPCPRCNISSKRWS